MSQSCLKTPISSCSPSTPASTSTYCLSANIPIATCPTITDAAVTNITGIAGWCYWCAPITSGSSSAGASTSSADSTASTKSPKTKSTNPSTAVPTTNQSSQSTTSATLAGQTTHGTGSGTKLNNGAVAGIGIGCAFAGALLAALIVFVLLRRKRQQSSSPQQHLPINGAGYLGQEKYGMVSVTREVKGATATSVDRLLPQPAEDDAIVGGLSKIRDSIKNHVQNYYHSGPVSHELVPELRLVDLSQATGIPTSALLRFLVNPATRLPTIRLFLGHLILSRCQGRTDGQPSFLPNEVSGLAAYQSSSNYKNSSQAKSVLFSKWKTISGVLLQQQYGQQPGDNDLRNGNIVQILAAAEPLLHPFINPSMDMNARQHSLEGIMKRAAQFAFLLFSQPGSFSFDFRGSGQPDSLLVFPAFLQIVSDEAEILSPPRVLSETEVISGLGR